MQNVCAGKCKHGTGLRYDMIKIMGGVYNVICRLLAEKGRQDREKRAEK